jgi:hypothetical protein
MLPSVVQPTMRGGSMIFTNAYKSLSNEMSLCMISFKFVSLELVLHANLVTQFALLSEWQRRCG